MRNVPVRVAAALMGKGGQFIRLGLQRKILPFGWAVKTGKKNWSYYISPAELMRYTGKTEKEMEEWMRKK